jgi:hypothetical protein
MRQEKKIPEFLRILKLFFKVQKLSNKGIELLIFCNVPHPLGFSIKSCQNSHNTFIFFYKKNKKKCKDSKVYIFANSIKS